MYTSASIGIVQSNPDYTQAEDVLRDADIAMYRAKMLGKKRYAIFDPWLRSKTLRLMEIENDLQHAISRNELEVHYQPIVMLTTGNLIGFEALVRWRHPLHGYIPPSTFIPIAEETDQIIEIDQWVLQDALQRVSQWHHQCPAQRQILVSVNLSTRQFSQPNMVEQIIALLQEHKVDPACLQLEITESALIEDSDYAINVLTQLRGLGISLSVDDFGTGFSSLSYLHTFPFNNLKIDRSFIDQMGKEGSNVVIVKTITTLARNLQMTVTAEGVESSQQLKTLQLIGCEYGQGYFFDRPLTTKAAMETVCAHMERQSRSQG